MWLTGTWPYKRNIEIFFLPKKRKKWLTSVSIVRVESGSRRQHHSMWTTKTKKREKHLKCINDSNPKWVCVCVRFFQFCLFLNYIFISFPYWIIFFLFFFLCKPVAKFPKRSFISLSFSLLFYIFFFIFVNIFYFNIFLLLYGRYSSAFSTSHDSWWFGVRRLINRTKKKKTTTKITIFLVFTFSESEMKWPNNIILWWAA